MKVTLEKMQPDSRFGRSVPMFVAMLYFAVGFLLGYVYAH